jgi:hypothetical protein
MALLRKGANWAYGTQGIGAPGIDEVTSASASKEYSVQVDAVGADGDLKGILYGGEKGSFSAEGYTNSSNVGSIGSDGSVLGVSGVITKAGVTMSNEDFVKAQVEGEGYAAFS